MGKGSSSRGTANTAGKPRATSLKAHIGQPGQKAPIKPSVLVQGGSASTGHSK